MNSNEPSIKETLGEDILRLMADVMILEACESDCAGVKGPYRGLETYHETFRLSDDLGSSFTISLPHNPEVQAVIDERVRAFWSLYDKFECAKEEGDCDSINAVLEELITDKVYVALVNFFIVGKCPGNPLDLDRLLKNAVGEKRYTETKEKLKQYYLKKEMDDGN